MGQADYAMLAETYDLDDDIADEALEHLRVVSDGPAFDRYQLHYKKNAKARPVSVHRWSDRARVEEEIGEALERLKPSAKIAEELRRSVEVVAIELGFSQLEDMGVVLAYEAARHLARKGDGIIVDAEDHFTAVRDGVFVDL